mgnify:CR=1 FL=1
MFWAETRTMLGKIVPVHPVDLRDPATMLALAEREAAILRQAAEVQQAKAAIDEQVTAKLEKERRQLTEAALKKAKEDVALELKDSQSQLTETQAKLKAAHSRLAGKRS